MPETFTSDRIADSREALVITISVKATPTSPPVDIPISEFVQELNVSLVDRGVWTGNLALFDAHGEFLDALSQRISTTSSFSIRFGRAQTFDLAPSYGFRVINADFDMAYNGLGVVYNLVGEAGNAYIDTAPKYSPLSLKPGDLVAPAFRAIAAYAGWEVGDVDENAKVAVPMAWKAGEPALMFADRLARNSTSDAVKGAVSTFLLPAPGKPVAFCVAAADFQRINETRRRHVYKFGRTNMGEVISFAPSSQQLWAAYSGYSSAQIVAQVLDGGEQIVVAAPAGSTTGGKSEAVPRNAPRIPIPSSDQRFVMAGSFTREFMDSRIAQWHEHVLRQAISMSAVVRGTHDIRPRDIFDISYYPLSTLGDRPHFLSLPYRVTGVAHQFKAGRWTTSVEGFSNTVADNDPNAGQTASATTQAGG